MRPGIRIQGLLSVLLGGVRGGGHTWRVLHTHKDTHTHIHIDAHRNMHIHIHKHIHMLTHKHTPIHLYIYIYMNVCIVPIDMYAYR